MGWGGGRSCDVLVGSSGFLQDAKVGVHPGTKGGGEHSGLVFVQGSSPRRHPGLCRRGPGLRTKCAEVGSKPRKLGSVR